MKKHLSDRLALPTKEGYIIITLEEIIHCQANGNYTLIYLNNDKRLIICRRLGKLETILSNDCFVRVHYSHIVNLLYLKQYLHEHGGQTITI